MEKVWLVVDRKTHSMNKGYFTSEEKANKHVDKLMDGMLPEHIDRPMFGKPYVEYVAVSMELDRGTF